MKYGHQFPDFFTILYLQKFNNEFQKGTSSNNELYIERRILHINNTAAFFFSLQFFKSFQATVYRQCCTATIVSTKFSVGLGNAPFMQLLRFFFFCEQIYSHYYLGKLDFQTRAAARQADTVNNFTTFEHLELIDGGQIFTIRGNWE